MLQLIFNIIISSSIYLLIATSFVIIYFPTKFFHIAHAGIITTGAYCVFFFANKFSAGLSLSIILGLISTTLIGIFCEIFVYRKMRKSNVPSLAYLIASIGLYVIMQNCISIYFGNDTKIINTTQVAIGNQFLGAYITTIQVVTVFISIAFFLAINSFLQFSSIGKCIRAVSSNAELCETYGIPSNKIIIITFGIGSFLAAAGGILSAMDTNMTPNFGFNCFLYGVVAMIIGGVGSYRGLIFGAILLATAQNLAAWYLDSKWMDAVAYIILILFLIWKPLGFSGQRLKKVEV